MTIACKDLYGVLDDPMIDKDDDRDMIEYILVDGAKELEGAI